MRGVSGLGIGGRVSGCECDYICRGCVREVCFYRRFGIFIFISVFFFSWLSFVYFV